RMQPRICAAGDDTRERRRIVDACGARVGIAGAELSPAARAGRRSRSLDLAPAAAAETHLVAAAVAAGAQRRKENLQSPRHQPHAVDHNRTGVPAPADREYGRRDCPAIPSPYALPSMWLPRRV